MPNLFCLRTKLSPQNRPTFCRYFFIVLSTLFFWIPPSWSARVIKSNGNKILIDLEGKPFSVSQNIELFSSQKKRVGLARITAIKGSKAIAIIINGQVQGGEIVIGSSSATNLRPTSSSNHLSNSPSNLSSNTAPPARDANSAGKFNKSTDSQARRWSLSGNYLSQSMSTKQIDASNPSTAETVNLKGTSFGLSGFYEQSLFNDIWLRAGLEYEPFTVSGTSKNLSCNNLTSKNCNAKITYLAASGFLRYNFNQSEWLFWIAGGGSFKLPLAKSSTALSESDIKMTLTYGLSLGIDYHLNNNKFIPIVIDQQFFPSSDTVTAATLALRVGYGQTF